jgi:geranylgeranyl diphosphate synthase type II
VNIDDLLIEEHAAVDAALRRLLPTAEVWPERLHRAMAYAVFAGGKRVRPILARLAHGAGGGRPDAITEALDNDVLRRGRPTVHVEFDEATAILVGDALLTEGLLLVSRHPEGEAWAERRAKATAAVAEAISARGMVGGQMEDLEATGQVEAEPVDSGTRLERIHRHKTGCLLRASVELGAILAGADRAARRAFSAFGESLGLAFQVADDILDATATVAELGKSPGKDAATGKLTFVTLYGLDSTRRRLDVLEEELVESARAIEGADGTLAAFARYICHRTS